MTEEEEKNAFAFVLEIWYSIGTNAFGPALRKKGEKRKRLLK